MGWRARHYAAVFAHWPASHLRVEIEQGREVLYGHWVVGATWGNLNPLYGSYPRTYLERMHALFPDFDGDTLHVFSGGLKKDPSYLRLDLRARPLPGIRPELVGSVYDAAALLRTQTDRHDVGLVYADPPYSVEHAKRYDTPMVQRSLAVKELARVVRPGGYVVWLDVQWPIHSATHWATVGRITVIRSTNHVVRLATILQRA